MFEATATFDRPWESTDEQGQKPWERKLRAAASKRVQPKRGEEIFAGTDYPPDWESFVGQEMAVTQLKAAVRSAAIRNTNLNHILLASGLHGIGKTTLAKLIAFHAGVGLVEVSGKISVDEIRPVLKTMEDGDILFIDEIHQLVQGGKGGAEWLLHLLQDGVLMTARGAEQMPKVTVVAATTDEQKLPQTILSRFFCKPILEEYNETEAALIARGMCVRMGFDGVLLPTPNRGTLHALARASNNSPREMKGLISVVLDAALGGLCRYTADGAYDLAVPLKMVGLTFDGLNRLAQEYLLALYGFEGRAGSDSLMKALKQTVVPKHTEELLTARNYVVVRSRGRELTDLGYERTIALLEEQGLMEG